MLRHKGERRYLPFFESYFSNFIEGTEFEVDEALAIVFEGRIPKDRPADAHDVLLGARARRQVELEATNAFRDAQQADAEGVRLILP